MRQDLDNLRREIEAALEAGAFTVFRGRSRIGSQPSFILWDTEAHPDPAEFLAVAARLSAPVIVFSHLEFDERMVNEALEKLEAAELPREETREYERRFRRLKGYVGFTCALEISFDHQGLTYLFELTTPWYDEFMGILDDLDDALDASDEDEPESPLGGYFSQN